MSTLPTEKTGTSCFDQGIEGRNRKMYQIMGKFHGKDYEQPFWISGDRHSIVLPLSVIQSHNYLLGKGLSVSLGSSRRQFQAAKLTIVQ